MSEPTSTMRTVSEKSKLNGLSLPEIKKAWRQAALDLGSDPEITEAARGALREGNLLNAFTIWCCLQSPAQRKEIAKFGLRALEWLKERNEAVDLRGFSVETFGQHMEIADADGVEVDEPATTPRAARVRRPSKRRAKRTG